METICGCCNFSSSKPSSKNLCFAPRSLGKDKSLIAKVCGCVTSCGVWPSDWTQCKHSYTAQMEEADLFVGDAYDFVDLPKSPFPEWLPAFVFASQSCGWEHFMFGESRF